MGYTIRYTDPHPILGGVTAVYRPTDTKAEATKRAEREVAMAKELGMTITYVLIKD